MQSECNFLPHRQVHGFPGGVVQMVDRLDVLGLQNVVRHQAPQVTLCESRYIQKCRLLPNGTLRSPAVFYLLGLPAA